MSSKDLQKAISDLAVLGEGWALMADTDPAEFMRQVQAEIARLKDILRRKGYRESCDVAACNCGEHEWHHGGHAEERLHEIAEEVWTNGRTALDSVRAMKAENARLRGYVQPDAICGKFGCERDDCDHERQIPRCLNARRALYGEAEGK